jgi:hypothetical protein
MYIQVFRVRFFKTHTIAQVYIDGDFFCFALEDVVREVPGQAVEKWKVPHETAIPAGVYGVHLENSPKFGSDTPTIESVPGFEEIRIHSGNTDHDTDGCLILGYKLDANSLIQFGTTRPAVADLKAKIKKAMSTGEKVYIEIRTMK